MNTRDCLYFYVVQFLNNLNLSSGQTLGVKAQRFRGHTSPHRNVKEKKILRIGQPWFQYQSSFEQVEILSTQNEQKVGDLVLCQLSFDFVQFQIGVQFEYG
eukprot:TRINITY_DN4995_c0_g1_i6.p4 TRINITY_DN4995_c0_g1~~TRINITY_DN4995_c0_g1_i6.p4  ORF type:complete len:114 (-),score=14.16 TRINITY_DN4995_c0_g1_i6:815-1117(-)